MIRLRFLSLLLIPLALLSVRLEGRAQEASPIEGQKPLQLLTREPQPGKVLRVIPDPNQIFTHFVLSNGAHVLLRTTKDSPGQVLLSARSPGGLSVLEPKNFVAGKLLGQAIAHLGVGVFSSAELRALLRPRGIHCTLSLRPFAQEVRAGAKRADLETMMQLVHLYFTDLRRDDEAFGQFLEDYRFRLQKKPDVASMVLADTVVSALYGGNPRYTNLQLRDLEHVDADRILEVARWCVADASDYTFLLVGDLEPQDLEPLLARYIASIPIRRVRHLEPDPSYYAPGWSICSFQRAYVPPQQNAYLIHHTDRIPFTLRNKLLTDLLTEVLSRRLHYVLQEKQSLVTALRSHAALDQEGQRAYLRLYISLSIRLEVSFMDAMIEVKIELERLSKEVDEAIFAEAKEAVRRRYQQEEHQLSTHMKALEALVDTGVDLEQGWLETLEALRPRDLSTLLGKLLAPVNCKELYMRPER